MQPQNLPCLDKDLIVLKGIAPNAPYYYSLPTKYLGGGGAGLKAFLQNHKVCVDRRAELL